MSRVYLPTTLAGLRGALEAGSLDATVGYAVTPGYASGTPRVTSRSSSTPRPPRRPAPRCGCSSSPTSRRRVVLAVEVADGAATPAPDVDRAAVRLAAAVPWSAVDSALVDDPSAADDVAKALAVLVAADAGDDDAAFTVDAVEDHELGWYAVQELSALVALEA